VIFYRACKEGEQLGIIRKKLVEGQIFQIINGKLHRALFPKNTFLFRCINRPMKQLDRILRYFPRKSLSNAVPTSDNVIMFLTYQGDYTCNPKAIADEMIRRALPYELIWVVRKDLREVRQGEYPEQLHLVKRGTYEFFEAAARAKVFVDNAHNLARIGVHKKKDQYLLQTWHGSLGIKRLDGSVVMNRKWKRLAKFSREETDYCISNSRFETEVFHSSYWKGVPVLYYGHARNDILFAPEEEKETIREKVRTFLGISSDQNILLYAPTHRDNQGEGYDPLDYEEIRKALEERFGGEWVIALRFHSRLRKIYRQWIEGIPPFVVDATDYADMQELMIAADVGVTDYSSWLFDYILMKKPGFILADDQDIFSKRRDFYYPLESTPFPIAANNEALAENIRRFDEERYLQDVDAFLEEKGCIEDGNASRRIADKIIELTK
jgi:CDP-glycerol glycerophosphotransferase